VSGFILLFLLPLKDKEGEASSAKEPGVLLFLKVKGIT
jgi:hypothetical protein